MLYRVAHSFFTQCLLILLLLMGSLSSQAHAALALTQCGQEAIALQPYLQLYQNDNAEKTLTDILSLADSAWQPVDKASLDLGFTRSAYWYRFSIDNQTQKQCRLWLDLGTVRVSDIQMYSQKDEAAWQAQRMGVAYSLSEWSTAQRVPSVRVSLSAANTTHFLLRVSSAYAFSITPELLSRQALNKKMGLIVVG